MRYRSMLTVISAAILLSGCMNKITTATPVTEVENCKIIEIQVKGMSENRPLYLAKCSDVPLASVTYSTGGKSSQQVSTTTAAMSNDEIVAANKAAALAKLTPDERALLGIKE